jgi:predicted dehydrogenase
MSKTESANVSRREFLKTSAAAAAATTLAAPAVHAAGSDTIKVGLIGCGGRGSGAAENVLMAAKGVEIVAVGDYFQDHADSCRNRLLQIAGEGKIKELGNKVDLPADRCYSGLDAYKKVIDTPGVNYIVLATPPGFRPIHLKAAVAAGKNVFTEKPVAVDGPGIRTCLKVYEDAKAANLGIVAGTQRRHQFPYLETVKALHEGAIGEVVGGRCYWNQGPIWFRNRKAGMSDMDYQIHNWYHFAWLCGDHIVEQHVHNLDVINWVTNSHPVRAVGMGGRVNPCKDPAVDGHIFNFFAIDYEYPNGVHVLSMCRQIAGCENSVSEAVIGTKGTCQVNEYKINGKPVVTRQQSRGSTDPYVQEHTDLIESIRAGKPLNELKNVTESTLTAIMGRMSAYTGKAISWDQALNSQQVLMPEHLNGNPPPTPPVAVPGRTEFV